MSDFVFDRNRMERISFDKWCMRYGIRDKILASKQREAGWSLDEIRMGMKRTDYLAKNFG